MSFASNVSDDAMLRLPVTGSPQTKTGLLRLIEIATSGALTLVATRLSHAKTASPTWSKRHAEIKTVLTMSFRDLAIVK